MHTGTSASTCSAPDKAGSSCHVSRHDIILKEIDERKDVVRCRRCVKGATDNSMGEVEGKGTGEDGR